MGVSSQHWTGLLKALKISGIVLLLLLLLVAGLLGILGNQKALDFVASKTVGHLMPELHYRSLRGDLFHGLAIEGFEYKNAIKGNLYLKADFPALAQKRLVIEEVNLSDLWIDEAFLKSLLEQNTSKRPKKNSSSALPLQSLEVGSLHLDMRDFRWEQYRVDRLALDLYDLRSDLKKSLFCRLKMNAKSNVADLNMEGDITLPTYRMDVDARVKSGYLAMLAESSGIDLKEDIPLHLKAEGDLFALHTDLQTDPFGFRLQQFDFQTNAFRSRADYALLSHDLNSTLTLDLAGDPGRLRTKADLALDLDDLNNSLSLRTVNEIEGDRKWFQKRLHDLNLTAELSKAPKLGVKLEGTLKKMRMIAKTVSLDAKVEGVNIRLEPLKLEADLSALKGDFNTTVIGSVKSNIANLQLDAKAAGNLKELNQTLKYDALAKLAAPKGHIKREKFDLLIREKSLLDMNLSGSMKEVVANLFLNAKLALENRKIDAKIRRAKLSFSPATHRLKTSLDLDVDGDYLKSTGNLDAAFDLNDIPQTLKHSADLKIERVMPFADLNLTALMPIQLKSEGGFKGLKSDLLSPKLRLHLQSPDLKTIDYRLTTKQIDIKRLYGALPAEILKLKTELKSSGSYKISQKALDATAKIESLQINEKRFSTELFRIKTEGEDFSLEHFALAGRDFLLRTDARKRGEKIDFDLKNRALSASGKMELSPLKLNADAKIPSIKALFDEIKKLYPIKTPDGIDGTVDFHARTVDRRVEARLSSAKITLPKGRIADIDITASAEGDRERGEIMISKAQFTLQGFKPRKMNRKIALKREGIIQWNEENAKVDIDFGEALSFKGIKKGEHTEADLLTYRLYLGYEGYGHTSLTTNLHLSQRGEKINATGLVKFDDTLITYQPRFLDISEDKDIVILTRKSKQEVKKEQNRDFIDNFALDIWVKSDDEMLYKTMDGEIVFQPKIRVMKRFGEPQKLIGKIKVLEGWYDFADKRYIIEEGAIAFRGQPQINPLLDLHVKYDEIEDVVIFIDINGDAKRPKLTFRSKPMMPKKEIFSYLLFGMSTSQVQGAAGNASKAAEKIFSRAVSKDLARELNLDRLDLQRNEEGGFDIKAGKKLNKKSILYYQNKQMQSRFIYERKMGKRWRIDLSGGQTIGKEGTGTTGLGIDLFYKRGYKKRVKR
ncbi:MAG: hypothetical protein B6D59_02950 [Campylobacteraceae bacterium 4484_4]|nr:MAG: hypothetical protein B6D59_02950 [Campylobacteraceae bacterium 4484_4]